jgi:hypothetical protein
MKECRFKIGDVINFCNTKIAIIGIGFHDGKEYYEIQYLHNDVYDEEEVSEIDDNAFLWVEEKSMPEIWGERC